jgi:hypothetical protein
VRDYDPECHDRGGGDRLDDVQSPAGARDTETTGPAGDLRGAVLCLAAGPFRFREAEVGHGGRRGLGKGVQGARKVSGRRPGPHCPERGPDVPEQAP